jgi:hypothetical protein
VGKYGGYFHSLYLEPVAVGSGESPDVLRTGDPRAYQQSKEKEELLEMTQQERKRKSCYSVKNIRYGFQNSKLV